MALTYLQHDFIHSVEMIRVSTSSSLERGVIEIFPASRALRRSRYAGRVPLPRRHTPRSFPPTPVRTSSFHVLARRGDGISVSGRLHSREGVLGDLIGSSLDLVLHGSVARPRERWRWSGRFPQRTFRYSFPVVSSPERRRVDARRTGTTADGAFSNRTRAAERATAQSSCVRDVAKRVGAGNFADECLNVVIGDIGGFDAINGEFGVAN